MAQIFSDPNCIHWSLMVIAGLATIGTYMANAQHRDMIDTALNKKINPPERMRTYDAAYLTKFRTVATGKRTDFGDTALAHYIRPTLLWNDVYFAIMFGAFLFLVGFNVAASVPDAYYLREILRFCGLMGLLYGIIDVAEDIYLAKLLGSKAAISESSATSAMWLTRLKLGTLGASGLGALYWYFLGFLYRKFKD